LGPNACNSAGIQGNDRAIHISIHSDASGPYIPDAVVRCDICGCEDELNKNFRCLGSSAEPPYRCEQCDACFTYPCRHTWQDCTHLTCTTRNCTCNDVKCEALSTACVGGTMQVCSCSADKTACNCVSQPCGSDPGLITDCVFNVWPISSSTGNFRIEHHSCSELSGCFSLNPNTCNPPATGDPSATYCWVSGSRKSTPYEHTAAGVYTTSTYPTWNSDSWSATVWVSQVATTSFYADCQIDVWTATRTGSTPSSWSGSDPSDPSDPGDPSDPCPGCTGVPGCGYGECGWCDCDTWVCSTAC
jgi:hypothetical protein